MYKLDIEQSKTIQDRYTFVEEITFAVSIFAKILTRIKNQHCERYPFDINEISQRKKMTRELKFRFRTTAHFFDYKRRKIRKSTKKQFNPSPFIPQT